MAFKEIRPEELTWNPFTQIGKGWFLVGAGNEAQSNAMTVSWGGMGVWWGKDAVTVYIRQNRFTKTLMDKTGRFTLSALPESYRKALSYMGSHSGKDGDKWGPAGLTPCMVDGTAAAAEADVILLCKTVLVQKLDDSSFVDTGMKDRWYAHGDAGNYHTMYIGTIEKVLVKED